MTQSQSQAYKGPQDNTASKTGPMTGRDLSAKESTQSKKSASAFRTISEVADDLDVQQHVLRFWETKFSQIRPLKRGGGRRYYRPEDLALLRTIHGLLYTEGYTIKGVQKLLKEKGKAQLVQDSPAQANDAPVRTQAAKVAQSAAAGSGLSLAQRSSLQAILGEMKELRRLIKPE